LPIDARASLIVLAAQLQALQTLIGSIEKRIIAQHRANEASKRLESIPGIGIVGATAISVRVMTTLMRNGRDRRSENPRSATRAKSACFWLGPISGSHQGQQPKRLHSKAGYMAAPERSDSSLAPRAPSIHGAAIVLLAVSELLQDWKLSKADLTRHSAR
jgi:hypothetical protein